MVQQGKALKDMTKVELKALAYDLISQGEEVSRSLQIVNQLIRKPEEPKAEPIMD